MLKKFLFAAAFLALFSSFVFSQQRREMYPPWPPSSLANSWEITKEQNKLILTSFFPYGAVDRKITLVLGNTNSTPSSGFAIYPMDFRRDLKDGEINYFWEYAGAKEAVARYHHQ